jgi:hypothetical protein
MPRNNNNNNNNTFTDYFLIIPGTLNATPKSIPAKNCYFLNSTATSCIDRVLPGRYVTDCLKL